MSWDTVTVTVGTILIASKHKEPPQMKVGRTVRLSEIFIASSHWKEDI